MITIMFVVSTFIQPSNVFDTSSAVLMDEAFVFTNIREKTESVVKLSDSCADLDSNLGEYKQFIQSFIGQRNARLDFDYRIVQPCVDNILATDFYIRLTSPRASIDASFRATK
jgi:hypothetical protein